MSKDVLVYILFRRGQRVAAGDLLRPLQWVHGSIGSAKLVSKYVMMLMIAKNK